MAGRGDWMAILLVGVALTGCIGDDGSDELEAQSTPGVSDDLLRLADPVALPQDKFGAEPNIAALPDGTLFITAPVGDAEQPNVHEGAAWLWRSTDGGASWEVLRDPWIGEEDSLPDELILDGAFCSCDADVVTSPDGWIYYTDWWIAGFAGPGNYLVEASDDGGETWQTSPITTIRTRNIDRQWLVAGQDGFVGLFYFHYDQAPQPETPFGRSTLEAVYSHDHGQTWSLPVTVVEAEPGSFDQISKPALTSDGTLAMAHGHMAPDGEDFWTAPGEVRVALSEDRGRSWEVVHVADAPDGFDNLWAVQTAADAAGNLYVAWAARTGENMTVFLSESADGGQTWSPPVVLREAGTNALPWVTARGDGQVAVAWYGGNATGDPVEADDEAAWYAYVAERAGPTAPFHVHKVREEPVKTGPFCPRGASCSGDRELLDYPSLVYDADGRLHIAFASSSDGGGAPIQALVHHAAELG